MDIKFNFYMYQLSLPLMHTIWPWQLLSGRAVQPLSSLQHCKPVTYKPQSAWLHEQSDVSWPKIKTGHNFHTSHSSIK